MIWKRYLYREMLKIFFLVLFGFFFIYAAMDYSLHMQDFIKDKKIHLLDFFIYYGHLFVKRTDILIPLAVLIATMKVLTTLNSQKELLAFQVAGLKFKTLIKPFVNLALICTLYNLFAGEFLLPYSLAYDDNFHKQHFRSSNRTYQKKLLREKDELHSVALKDRSKVVYQHFDPEKGAYFDVYWIRSNNDIWRMKFLKTDGAIPEGQWVDHLVRNPQGFFEKAETHTFYKFDQLKWNQDLTENSFVPYENRRPSELWREAGKSNTSPYEKTEIMANFYFKCAMPLLSLLLVIAISPFCIRYSRTQVHFFTYAFGIFGYIAFYLIMNSAVILGANRVVAPFGAIFLPFALSGAYFGWKFAKTE